MRRLAILACLVVAACGDDDRPAADGQESDGARAIDSATDSPATADGAPALVSMTVYHEGTPVPGATVVYHRADGSVDHVQTTDANGRAEGAVAEGGSVTAVHRDAENDGYSLTTITGVEPGDRLQAGRRQASTSSNSLELTLPGSASGATSYRVEHGCGYGIGKGTLVSDPASPFMVALAPGCTDVIDLYAQARSDANEPVGYAFVDDVVVVAPVTQVTIPDWTVPTAEVTLMGVDAPPRSLAVAMSHWFLHRGNVFGSVGFPEAFLPLTEGGQAMVSHALPVDGVEGVRAFFRLDWGSGATSTIVRQITVPPWWVDIYLSAMPPPLRDLGIDRTEVARPSVTWTALEPTSSTAGALELEWTDAAGSYHLWQVLVPSSVALPFVFPELPLSAAMWRPRVDDVSLRLSVQFSRFEAVTYDDVRQYFPNPEPLPTDRDVSLFSTTAVVTP